MPLSKTIDENRVCVEIQGKKHCLLLIESKGVNTSKAAALVSSIVCERGQSIVVWWIIKRRIKNILKSTTQLDVTHRVFHVQVGQCYFVQDEHTVPHKRY